MATTFFKPLSCFEPESFERFATVSQDGRLKIFDTRTGGVQQQLTEKEHLSAQYTAIAWGASTFQGVDQAERSKRAKKQLGGAVAIGTAKGSIVVWDLLRGEVHKVLGGKEGHSGKVNDLVFTEGATFLFSCSDDLQVIKWNIENGEIIAKFKADNQPISSLGLSADNATLATGSAMIKMWDLASSKSQKKFTGHASAVTCLNFSPNGKFLVSSSSSERFASVWNLKSSIEAAAVFTASSNPIYVEFSKPKNAKASLVLALLRAGSVGVWQFDHKADREDKATSQKPNTTIKVVRSSGAPAQDKKKMSKSKPGQVLFAQFTGEHEILIAYGTTTKPVFERVNLLNEATGQFKSKITIVDDSELGGALIPTEAASAPKGVVRTSVIGPSQLESLARAGVATQASKKAEPASKQAEAKKPATPKQTLTLQEQLDRMQITATSVEDEQKEEDEEKMEEENAFEKEVKQMVSYWGGEKSLNKKKLKANQVAPKATSLASALGQAIHTKDRQLLERVLQIGQEQIIIGTIKRLQQVHVLPFLQLILERFRAKPNRSLALLVWIRAVLVEHVAYLSTVPSLLTALSELYSTVRSRLSNHKSYVKLVGRLELLDAQIQERNARVKAYKNVHVYREDHDNGQHADDDDDDEDDDGVSVMDAMDMGDEDEQDMLHGDEDDSDDEEIEDDGVNEDDDNEDDEDDDEEVQDDDEDGGVRLQRKRRQARDEEDGSDDDEEAAEEDDGEGDAGEIEADDDDDDDEDDEEDN